MYGYMRFEFLAFGGAVQIWNRRTFLKTAAVVSAASLAASRVGAEAGARTIALAAEQEPARPVAANPARARSAAVRPTPAGTSSTHSSFASSAPSPPRADRTDTLQALLASLKRDLKDASQL